MDQLETQVSDLRTFLALPPRAQTAGSESVATPDGYSSVAAHPPSQHSPLSGDNSAQQSGSKRPLDDDAGARQQRSKRNRYISIACNECKRRKIKCNGQTPCQRCGNLNLPCLYAPNCCSTSLRDSDEFRHMAHQVAQLQDQVNALFGNMNALRQEALRLAPIQDRSLLSLSNPASSPSASSGRSVPRPPAPRVPPTFSGPTSLAFTVDVAKNTLHGMGCTGVAEGEDAQQDLSAATVATAASVPSPYLPPSDPLWDFSRDEMARLCRVHQDDVGIMYPVVDVEAVIQHAMALAAWMDSVGRNRWAAPQHSEEADDLQTLTLKIVLCSGLAVDENASSPRATLLYDSMQAVVDRKLMTEPASAASLPFLALVAGFRFLSNEEVLAWRIIGQVARLCLELGLHRRDGLLRIRDDACRRDALATFWSAYVLDRRWSFSTGLPYVLHDDKIDPKLPKPDQHPFLVAMISYSKLAAKIWRLVDYFEPAVIRELKQSDFDTLDAEILHWYESVPEAVRLPSEGLVTPSPSYDLHRLRIWTRLRLNQIRIWLHTPILHSASSIAENMPLARRAVDLAKDTIEFLTRLNRTTDMYQKIQVFYHQFLTSSIAILFLASTHAPLHFSAGCRTEFYMALDLVKDMSARSLVSQRLWRIIHSLDSYAPWLGLRDGDDVPPHSSTTAPTPTSAPGFVATSTSQSPPSLPPPTANLIAVSPGHPSPDGNLPHQLQQPQLQQPGTEDPSNGVRLQTKMSQIFEGCMGINKQRHGSAVPHSHSPHPPSQYSGSPGSLGGDAFPSPGDELNDGMYQYLKVMF